MDSPALMSIQGLLIRTAAIAVASTAAFAPSIAEACGCFAPPTVGEPVVQAGERIVFAHDNGKVVAHIQIQFEGQADDFAWLVPMPAVPELRIGTEELFIQLETATAPKFILTTTPGDGCGGSGFGCAASDAALAARAPEIAEAGVAVKQSSAGPYDYAVVKADDKQPMLDWLISEGYFVPAGTQAAVDPYIRPGAFFLALKLQAGQQVGDIQPVIVEYASERPMIPIILTAVAANPDMGILVWVLGEHRAVPHNYRHVLINQEYIDWQNGASNYAAVVSKAIDEAEDHHAFVTEFAGKAPQLKDQLAGQGRFGRRADLEAAERPARFVEVLRSGRFAAAPLIGIMRRELSIPEHALEVTPEPFSGQTTDALLFGVFFDYAVSYRGATFDPVAVTAEIWERIVVPATEANKLFAGDPTITRMFTTLDPEEMTEDPVFAFNPDLPAVSNVHNAEMISHCDGNNSRELILDDGRVYAFDREEPRTLKARESVPFAEKIEVLRQEGAPEVVADNSAALHANDDVSDFGCDGGGHRRSRDFSWTLGLIGVLFTRTLMRKRS